MPRDYLKEYQRERQNLDNLNIRIPREKKAQLKAKTESNGISISQWVLSQIELYLNDPPK